MRVGQKAAGRGSEAEAQPGGHQGRPVRQRLGKAKWRSKRHLLGVEGIGAVTSVDVDEGAAVCAHGD